MNQVAVTDGRKQAVQWIKDERIAVEIRRALPEHVSPEWFLRCAQTAILNNPNLVSANKESLLRELVAIAQLGLALDPQLGEAWLIVDHRGHVQRRVGYQGLRKLALQSGEVTALNAQAVYENDVCEITLGDSPGVTHAIDIKRPDRGKIIGCYAVGKVKGTDEPAVEWMSWDQIVAHKNKYSPSSSGPWSDPLAQVEMGRKTVFRRLCKWLPKSPELIEALGHEERAEQGITDITARELAMPDYAEPQGEVDQERSEVAETKRRGRPPGSKNKPKDPETGAGAGPGGIERDSDSIDELADDFDHDEPPASQTAPAAQHNDMPDLEI